MIITREFAQHNVYHYHHWPRVEDEHDDFDEGKVGILGSRKRLQLLDVGNLAVVTSFVRIQLSESHHGFVFILGGSLYMVIRSYKLEIVADLVAVLRFNRHLKVGVGSCGSSASCEQVSRK